MKLHRAAASLYRNLLKIRNLGLAKAPGFDLPKKGLYYNIGPFLAVKLQELSLRPKTKFSVGLGLSSLKLTLACIILAMALVFLGTLYQAQYGALAAQNMIFRCLFVYWHPANKSLRVPILPGGYLLGTVFLINLVAMSAFRFKLHWKKIGILLIHGSLILFIFGEILRGVLSSEVILPIKIGEKTDFGFNIKHSVLTVNYDSLNGSAKAEIAFPENQLKSGAHLHHADLPFTIHIQGSRKISSPIAAEDGTFIVDIEVLHEGKLLSRTSLSTRNAEESFIDLSGRSYRLSAQPEKHYFPFHIELTEFKHEDHPGTQVPKTFSSFVKLYSKDGMEQRQALIAMNHPLSFQNRSLYQSGFGTDQNLSILQVVENPVWIVPYLSAALLAAGLLYQFLLRFYFYKHRQYAGTKFTT